MNAPDTDNIFKHDDPAPHGNATATLVQQLRKAILSGQFAPNERLAPIREVARRAGVSYSTARDALGKLELEGLVVRHPGSGTRIAPWAGEVLRQRARTPQPHAAPEGPAPQPGPERATATKPADSPHVALLLSTREHVFGRLAADLADLLAQRDLIALKCGRDPKAGPEQFDRLLQRWHHQPPRAIVVNWTVEGLDDRLNAMLAPRVPLIAVLRDPPPGSRWHTVSIDWQRLGDLAIDTMLQRGHERVGVLVNRRFIGRGQPRTHQRKRHVGHTSLITGLGHALRQRGRRHVLTVHYGFGPPNPNRDRERPLDAVANPEELRAWLTGPNRPTALIGADFRVAGALEVAERAGLKRGRDLEVLGIGNTPWAYSYRFPSLSFREPVIAQRVVELLSLSTRELLDTTRTIAVVPELVEH